MLMKTPRISARSLARVKPAPRTPAPRVRPPLFTHTRVPEPAIAPRKKIERVRPKKARSDKSRKQLTDLMIKQLRPKAKQFTVWDSVQKGLHVCVNTAGSKTFRSQFKLHGKHETRSIGRFLENSTDRSQDFSIRAARERCRLDRALALEGRDPRIVEDDARKQAEADAYTIDQALTDYIEYKRNYIHSWDQTDAILRRAFAPYLKVPANKIGKRELLKVMQDYIAEGKTPTAVQFLAYAKPFFKWLGLTDKIPFNFARDLPAPAPRGTRHKVFSDSELKAIWDAAGNLACESAVYVRLIMLTASRKTALALMRWDEIDKETATWTTPWSKTMKTAKPRKYVTPLCPLARQLLAGLKKRSERVFPALRIGWTDGDRPYLQAAMLERHLRNEGAPDVDWHTFRHTLATWLENKGHDLYDRALVLNHAAGGVTAGYSHGHALERKRGLLAAWSAHVKKVVA